MSHLPALHLPSWALGHRFPLSHAFVVLAICLPLLGASAAAQQATPTSPPLTRLNLPELRIVVTDRGAEVPSEAPTGRILVVLENQSTADRTDINILGLPGGVGLDDLNALFDAGAGELPDWFADVDSLGGFNVDPGQTGYAVLDLPPGEWFIGVGDNNPYAALTATGPVAESPAAPPADITVDLHAFASELPDAIPPGPLVWHATNSGDRQHELLLIRTPELLTIDQVVTILTLTEGGTPPAGIPDPASFEFVASGLKTMSPGHDLWVEMELEPGYYVAVCLSTDPETGQPHALLGEFHIFTVGDPASPAS